MGQILPPETAFSYRERPFHLWWASKYHLDFSIKHQGSASGVTVPEGPRAFKMWSAGSTNKTKPAIGLLVGAVVASVIPTTPTPPPNDPVRDPSCVFPVRVIRPLSAYKLITPASPPVDSVCTCWPASTAPID